MPIVQMKKVLLDFFQKIVGSRGNALVAPRKARNTLAYIKRRRVAESVRGTVSA